MSSNKRFLQIFRKNVNKVKNINRLVKKKSSFEGFFASKGAAVAIPDGDFARKATLKGGELQFHLQGMVNMLRDEDAVRLIVKLETEAEYTRYLSIVTCYDTTDQEESMLIGFDWVNEEVTIGLVIPLWSHVSIGLDGDGGFKVETKLRDYIFKPVSVQTMWTALQWIHRCITTAQQANQHPKGLSHSWLGYYQNRISSPREFINYWESMDGIQNKRDECLTYFDKVKTDEELLKRLIRHKLKEILKRFDLEEVTCREIRNVLEAETKMSLNHLKGFVDEQMFIVVGQMDSSSKITDNIFLGSEWNASNLQELKENGVGYILNITKEIDNFFPGTFEYMNIRLYDAEESDLLQHWSETYRFLHEAKEKGCAALVHCRRGISRSASTVVAFLMKEHNMSLHDAMKLVKSKRCIVEPNAGFWKQLIVYEGMLKSSQNRHNKLFRRRVNSDSTGSKRSPRKSQRQKKETCSESDNIDGTSTHAHTLPRMTSHEGDPAAAPLETETEDVNSIPQLTKTYITSEMRDADSEDEPSDSESETSTSKLRRSFSEPLMRSLEDCSHIPKASERKQRARTFTEHTRKSDSESSGDLKSPTWSTEMIENTQGDTASNGTSSQITEQSPDVETEIVLETAEEKLDELSLELSPGSTNLSENTNLDIAGEDNGKGPIADEVELIVTDTEVCVTVGDGAELARDDPRDNDENSRDGPMVSMDSSSSECDQPRSRSIGEKLEEKLVLKQGKSESSENLKKVEGRGRVRRRVRKSKSDLQLSNSGFVKRHTQVIEEQMLYSLLMNSEKTLASSAVSPNDAHVTEGEAPMTEGEAPMTEGEAPMTEGVAPVDHSENDAMLLSPEIRGDCENSNVIAAENKKYSDNNEENSEKNKENSENNEQNSEKNKETSERNEENSEENEDNSEDNEQNSEKNKETTERNEENSKKNGNNSENNEQNSENNEQNFKEIEDNSEKNEQNFVKNVENCGNNEEEESSKNDEKEKNSENNVEMKNPEIDAESERNFVIQNIVQEVNAEAKRDIQGQVASWLPLVSQKESGTSDPQGNDDVCIDEMAWIDLTHHHGDVVKRKSAAFENASEERNQAISATEFSSWKDEETGDKLGRSLTRPRGEMEPDQHFLPEVDKRSLEIPRDDGNVAVKLSTSDGEGLIEGLDHEVLRLDLGELVDDEELSETSRSSNSIVVDDYGGWESSSVRERTKILEKIIAKNGGSFPSPRAREFEKETPSTVDEKSKVEVNRLLSSSSDTVEIRNDLLMVEDTVKARARSSSCPLNNSLSLNDDELFGEEMVKILVNKFEGKNEDLGSKCHDI